MALNIPIPRSGADALESGLRTGSSLMDRIIQNNLRQKTFNIQQQAADRQQQLLPLMIQQYKDQHNKAQYEQFIRNKVKEAYDQKNQQQVAGSVNASPTEDAAMSGIPMMQDNNQTPAYTPIQSEQAQISGMPAMQQSDMGYTPVDPKMQALQKFVEQTGLGKSRDMQIQRPAQQEPNLQNIIESLGLNKSQEMNVQRPVPDAETANQSNSDEKTIDPGNPAFYPLDKVAGISKDVPKVTTHYGKNGVIYKQYPSGKITSLQGPDSKNPAMSGFGGVDLKNLAGLSAQIKKDYPSFDDKRADELAGAWLDGARLLSDGTPVPKPVGIAKQMLVNIRKRNAPAQIQNTAANMAVLKRDIDDVDISPIAKFGTLEGKMKYASEALKMSQGKPVSKDFRKAKEFRDVTSSLIKDSLRKGFGASVVPSNVEAILGKASNPQSDWWNDPVQIVRDWKAVKDWVDKNAAQYGKMATQGVSSQYDPYSQPEPSTSKTTKWKIVDGKLVGDS